MLKRCFLTLLVLALTGALASDAAARVGYKVLYQFTGGTDGSGPTSTLLLDPAGNLYGTSAAGGDLNQCGGYGCGVVFELTRSADGQWREAVLYAFHGGLDGSFPTGNLVFDGPGNLYGTTFGEGNAVACTPTVGCGTVFELSRQRDGSWTKKTVYAFQGISDGAYPAGLIFDASGKLYGTTAAGGSRHDATAYVLSPPKQQGGAWTKEVLFDGFLGTPNPVLVFDDHGNLHGTYYSIDVQFCGFNCGAVFELKNTQGNWAEADLYDFRGGGNGGQPAAGVIQDSRGNLYGTAAEGGNNFGILFEVRPSGGQWKEKMLYNFCSRNNCVDGAFPLAGLVMDGNGVLYGTTSWGGAGCSGQGCGVVFKLVDTKSGWRETVLHNFLGGNSDGANPREALTLGAKGKLYGVAGSVAFEITP
jgi:hypothetical protein